MGERLNGRMAIALSAAGLLAVLLVGWFAFLAPQRSQAADLALQVRETEGRLVATQALIKSATLRQSSRELTILRIAVPDEVRMPGIIRQLSRAATQSRVRILSIAPVPVVPSAAAADTVPISLGVEGRYFGIIEFLRLLRTMTDLQEDKLEATGRLFAAQSIQFDSGGAESEGLIQATIMVSAFAFRGPLPTANAATGSAPAEEAPAAEASGG